MNHISYYYILHFCEGAVKEKGPEFGESSHDYTLTMWEPEDNRTKISDLSEINLSVRWAHSTSS